MENQTASLRDLRDALAGLREEVTALRERVAALEISAPPVPARRTHEAAIAEGLSDELVLTITAAIAAYLGVQPFIRQIRLVESTSWAMQGRATIQASHVLPVAAERRTH